MVRQPGSLDVVIVAFHSGAVIGAALAAIEEFAPGSRVIVVDNSPDDPSARAAAEGSNAAEVLAEPKNVGFAAAVNHGLARSTGEIVLLANPDIHSLRGSLASIRRIFDANPRAAAVTVRLVDERGRLQHCRRSVRPLDLFAAAVGASRLPGLVRRRVTPAMFDWDHSEERVIEQATGALLFLRRAAMDDVGPLDESFFMYWEETDWLERARRRNWQLVFTPEVQAVHVVSTGSEGGATSHWLLLLASTHTYARKHFGAPIAIGLRFTWTLADLTRLLVGGPGSTPGHRRELRDRLRLHLGLTRGPMRGEL
jgi:hypothetical protein